MSLSPGGRVNAPCSRPPIRYDSGCPNRTSLRSGPEITLAGILCMSKLLTKTEVSTLIGVSPRTINHWIQHGKFPRGIRLNGQRFIRWRECRRAGMDRRATARLARVQQADPARDCRGARESETTGQGIQRAVSSSILRRHGSVLGHVQRVRRLPGVFARQGQPGGLPRDHVRPWVLCGRRRPGQLV